MSKLRNADLRSFYRKLPKFPLRWPSREEMQASARVRRGFAKAAKAARQEARAQALVREQLKHGPKSEASIMAAAEAADIPEYMLIAAADVLGVRTQRGQWRLPG
jgi:hypothetical protein